MDELHTTGMKRDAAVRIGTAGTVFQVSLDGTAHGRELTAYLVVTACEKLHLHEVVTVALSNGTIAQDSLLGVGHLMVVGVRLVLLLVAGKPVDGLPPAPSNWRGRLMRSKPPLQLEGAGGRLYYRPICLVDLTLLKHLVESGEGLRSPGKHDDTRDRTVEPMYHTEEYRSWLLIFLFQVGLDGF
jgi:hypothetical protein